MRKLLALFCVLVASSAAAQPAPVETVISNASALIGVWKVAWPQWGRMGFGGATWGPMADRFCRIAQSRGDLAIHCFRSGGNAGSTQVGTASLDGYKIHFAWGSMMLRLVHDGDLQSPTRIAGKMGVKFSGILHENPAPSNAEKFSLADAGPDTAGKAALLRQGLEQLARGPLTLPRDDATICATRGDLPGDIAALGAIHAIVYLGPASCEVPSPGGLPKLELNYFSVYAVEFDGGERICGLHQRQDGIVDAFQCV